MRNIEEAKRKKKYEDGLSLCIKSLKALANSSYSLLSFTSIFGSMFVFVLCVCVCACERETEIHKHLNMEWQYKREIIEQFLQL